MKALKGLLAALPSSTRLIATRRYYILPLLPLLWLAFQRLLLLSPDSVDPEPVNVLNSLMGFPLTLMACFLGVRIIASECEQRTLEIAYTVPGGAHRIWIPKLVAALLLLLSSEVLLAIVVQFFFTDVPLGSLYGAFQLAMVHLALAMALATFFRSTITGGLAVAVLVAVELLFQATRISPFWNPVGQTSIEAAELLAMTVKHRVGFGLVTAALIALSFGRAQRREKMLG